ncbi:MAG: histidine kinase [Thiobacillaceae bacterium]|nr:histidine kinase [Thiobacillaceae bacterium]
MSEYWHRLTQPSIKLYLAAALVVITSIGMLGMTVSVLVAEGVQGSGSAINVAGSLRMQSHRMGSLVMAGAQEDMTGPLSEAMRRFEASLEHPSLLRALERTPAGAYAESYRSVREQWTRSLRPLLAEEARQARDPHDYHQHRQVLLRIEFFVDDINEMVARLEHETEQRIQLLRRVLGVALLLSIALSAAAMVVLQRRVLTPLRDLLGHTSRLARGEFTARVPEVSADELGQVARAFNVMADELSGLYRGLEARVAEKTAELTRSNLSLQLLYNAISRLYNNPVSGDAYGGVLRELETLLDLRGGMVCLLPEPGRQSMLLASTTAAGPGIGLCEDIDCAECGRHADVWRHRDSAAGELITMPLGDAERRYGVMRLALPEGRELEAWQEQLLRALGRHIGIALGIAHQSEQERRLALLEERSVIARELHDSIAQALSFLKIQVSLLQPMLQDPARRGEAEGVLAELREGINAAYRQLRELLATFRFKMEGDFLDLLRSAVEEYARRGGLRVDLNVELGGCRLTPNQEVHLLHIVREALSNVLRHAQARAVGVDVRGAPPDGQPGEVTVSIQDDGVGMPDGAPGGDHYGLSIMRERALGLGGEIRHERPPEGGTRVTLRFPLVAEQPPTPASGVTDAA